MLGEYYYAVCPYRFTLFKTVAYCACGRDFYLAHRDLLIPRGSWVAFGRNQHIQYNLGQKPLLTRSSS